MKTQEQLKKEYNETRFKEWLNMCPVEFKTISKHPSSYEFLMGVSRDTSKYTTIEASGHYLTEHLPDDFEDWSDEKLYKYCEDHATTMYEYMDGEDLFHEMMRD